jgi:hypothetical protein
VTRGGVADQPHDVAQRHRCRFSLVNKVRKSLLFTGDGNSNLTGDGTAEQIKLAKVLAGRIELQSLRLDRKRKNNGNAENERTPKQGIKMVCQVFLGLELKELGARRCHETGTHIRSDATGGKTFLNLVRRRWPVSLANYFI